VVTFTGTQSAAALGSLRYQPVFSNVHNLGSGTNQDQVGTFRAPPNNILLPIEGETSNTLDTYGRVSYGSTASTTLLAHRHSAGANGAPAGDYVRIALASGIQWYPPNGTGTLADSVNSLNSQNILGTQNLIIFRQAFTASIDVPTLA